ncbi:LysR family transcriptional regulator [Pokkaliibacter sp. MBI-7]|uniref:LysR family transcriptional regulator n=1 Tax=Pokkaliibacter sp. MBI-7 TaxID=3040600 RepID=UPI0024494C86|nr:LysR family transcriptional regulator [Pokkaliibacter sp. MBI-7]MDH2434091.1 LysR family transcriptional regulator [Pokkaliibacter sp. MBI-7]
MELRHLRYFHAVAETLNFTRAAERLHIAQPPLSRQIQQLEEELGVSLIERDSRPLKLTKAGRYFYQHTTQLLSQLGEISESTRRIGLGQRRWFGIGFAPSTLYGALPELIRALRRDAELDVGLTESTTLQQVEALKNGRIDIGFGRIIIDDPSVIQEVLTEDPLVAALPVGHRLIGEQVSLRELAREPFVLYPGRPRPSYADHVIEAFRSHGHQIQVAQFANELQTAIGLVTAGMGITLVPSVVQRMHRDDLVYVPIAESGLVSPIIMSRRRDDQSALLQSFVTLVRQHFAPPLAV